MKVSVIYIINEQHDLNITLDNFKTLLKNNKYEIILVNNILNYDLTKYYNNDLEHLKIINLSKSFSYNMALLRSLELIKGNIIISVSDLFHYNLKDIENNLKDILENKKDQIIYYNKEEDKPFKKGYTTIGAWIFNKEVKDSLLYLFHKNIKFTYQDIGFNTKEIFNDNIKLIKENDDDYALIKNKIGFDESIL